MKRFAIAFLLSSAACGYTDEGSGSNTLFVEAVVRYSAGNNRSDVDIRVSKNDAAVDDADVILEDGDSEDRFTIDLDGGGGNAGRYRREIDGYHRRLALAIRRNSDELDAKLEGPGPHTVDTPRNGEPVDRSELGGDFKVEWTVDDGVKAQEVTVSVDDEDYDAGNDDGSFEDIPTSAVSNGEQSARVRRTNKIDLAGGVARSLFEISYSASNDFVMGD